MKYNAETKELYTDKGELIKKLECSSDVNWGDLKPGKNDFERVCDNCSKSVMDVEFLSDEEVQFLLNKNPGTCLRIYAQKY